MQSRKAKRVTEQVLFFLSPKTLALLFACDEQKQEVFSKRAALLAFFVTFAKNQLSVSLIFTHKFCSWQCMGFYNKKGDFT